MASVEKAKYAVRYGTIMFPDHSMADSIEPSATFVARERCEATRTVITCTLHTDASDKASCTREPSGCRRCVKDNARCSYSRSGVIRRSRRRKAGDGPAAHTQPTAQQTVLTRPQLADDLTSTHDRLSRLAGKEHTSFKALGALFEEYRSTWHDDSTIEQVAKDASSNFFLHEDKARTWVNGEEFFKGGFS